MMTFTSPFQKEIEDFLSLRQASLSKSTYAHDCRYLADFDRFADIYTNEKSVSEALINGWLHTRKGKSSSIANEVIVMMYGCGLRIGETLALRMRDVDLIHGILTMRHTKGDKQRNVPMHPLLTKILERYCLAMGFIGTPDAWLFPVPEMNEPMSPKDAQHCFENILHLAGISLPGRKKHERGPCLHCMRHVFVFKSFSTTEKAGRAIDDSIPYLSIYLGHDSLQETEKYMKFSSELFPDEMELFSEYSSDVFPEVSYET